MPAASKLAEVGDRIDFPPGVDSIFHCVLEPRGGGTFMGIGTLELARCWDMLLSRWWLRVWECAPLALESLRLRGGLEDVIDDVWEWAWAWEWECEWEEWECVCECACEWECVCECEEALFGPWW